MAKLKHDAEGYRTLCILLVVAIAMILWGWHNSEKARVELVETVEELRQTIEELGHGD